MKAENKFFVKEVFFSGIIFASLMAGFDYSDGKEFVITKFIFHLLFFGLFFYFLVYLWVCFLDINIKKACLRLMRKSK